MQSLTACPWIITIVHTVIYKQGVMFGLGIWVVKSLDGHKCSEAVRDKPV